MKSFSTPSVQTVLFVGAITTSIAALTCLGVYGWKHLVFASQSSLWTDEFVSIDQFTSQGLWHTLTNYPIPNNHILYNAINALWLPETLKYYPLFVRMLAFATLGAALLLAIGPYGFQRVEIKRWGPLVGLAIGGSLLASSEYLQVNLQARGYSLMALAIVAQILLLVRYLDRGEVRDLYIMGLTVVVGQWSVPIYIALGGAILFVLFLFERSWRTFLTGGVTLGVCVLLYLPAWFQFYGKGGAEIYRGQFSSPASIAETIQIYLTPGSPTTAIALVVLAALAPLVAWLKSRGTLQAGKMPEVVLALALVIFFLLCLKQEPHFRTVAFSVTGICAVLAFALARIHRDLANVVAIGVSTAILLTYPKAIQSLELKPNEAWKDVAKVIEEWSGPEALIAGAEFPEYLQAYLPKEKHREATVYADSEFANSMQILVDDDFKKPRGERLAREDFDSLRVAVGEFPQLRRSDRLDYGFMRVFYVPPHLEGIRNFRQQLKPGTTSGMTSLLELSIEPESTKRSLLIYAPRNNRYKPPKIKYRVATDEKWRTAKRNSLSTVATYTWKFEFERETPPADLEVTLYLTRASDHEVPGLAVWLGD